MADNQLLSGKWKVSQYAQYFYFSSLWKGIITKAFFHCLLKKLQAYAKEGSRFFLNLFDAYENYVTIRRIKNNNLPENAKLKLCNWTDSKRVCCLPKKALKVV